MNEPVMEEPMFVPEDDDGIETGYNIIDETDDYDPTDDPHWADGAEAEYENKQNNVLQIPVSSSSSKTKDWQAYSALTTLKGMRKYQESAPQPIPTGFKLLDGVLGGGLDPGLITLGAITSLGKSCFAGQIAAQTAAKGHPCIIFSLEMDRYELLARWMSREAYIASALRHMAWPMPPDKRFAEVVGDYIPSKSLLRPGHLRLYKGIEEDLRTSQARFCAYGDKIIVVDCNDDDEMTLDSIVAAMQEYVADTKQRPLVIVDYLQLIDVETSRPMTDKQRTDMVVKTLRRTARRLQVPIMLISSLNRDNYDDDIKLAAFKESGIIEYSSDVVLGLQFYGQGDKGFDLDRAKSERIRNVEVKILKHRGGGGVGERITYAYTTTCNQFDELDTYVKGAKKGSGDGVVEKRHGVRTRGTKE